MNRWKKGFSLVELMLVIAVMGVLATVTIGGITKASKASREKRIDAMCSSLTLALTTYRAQEGCWPLPLKPGSINGTSNSSNDERENEENMNKAIFTGDYNRNVFGPLIPKKGTKKGFYLEPSGFFTKVNGRVVSLRDAIDQGVSLPPLGYPDPNNQREFRHFRVEFNLLTDSVVVYK